MKFQLGNFLVKILNMWFQIISLSNAFFQNKSLE